MDPSDNPNDNPNDNHQPNPAPFAPRGKNSAMLCRLRSRDSNDDPLRDALHRAVPFAAAAAHRDTADDDNDDRDPLNRLVQRLRREYAANFASFSSGGGGFTLRPTDLDRARYLLEATAGNVGLASWLYWEDYLTSNGAAWNRQSALDASSPAAAASAERHDERPVGLKRHRDDDEPEEEPHTDDAEPPKDEDDDRKPPSKKSKMIHTARATTDVHAPANEAGPDRNDPPSDPQPDHPLPLHAFDASSPNLSQRQVEFPLHPPPPPPPAANRRRWLHHPLDQLQQLAPRQDPPDHPPDPRNLEALLLEFHRPRHDNQLHPRVSDLLSRLLQGRPLDEEETRFLLRSLGEVPVAPAAGGDDHHDDDDDDDDDHRSPGESEASFDWNEPFVNMMEEASPRRASRHGNRREGGENENRAAAGGARPWEGNDGGASISDDDNDAFVPVFREMAGKGREVKSVVEKRKKGEEGEVGVAPDPLCREELEEEEDGSVVWEDSAMDMTEFFNPADTSVYPMDILWARTGGENDDDSDDEETMTSIPLSWLRTGFVLSGCGSGLAVASPSDEEWEIVRRSHPQIIRDGPLKAIKGLFPFHCKGLSALLSIVTALLYSGASIRGSTVTCDADVTPFHELTPEQRKEEFPKRLTEALSALIFIAAQSMSLRCAKALAAMDRRHARRRKKHVLTQEDEDEFTMNRLKLQRRVRQCRVCSWEPDTANNDAPILPQGRDPKEVRVHSSLTNIRDIRSYVKSHLRSFTEPGGCALFLETIARCHGSAYFDRLLDSRGKGEKSPEDAKVALVGCQCQETLRYLERRSKDKNLPEGMPDEHDCIRAELLSLLLSGEAHSNYQNWHADSLGIGLLRIDKESVVGTRLLRPLKPIWVCLGDFGYSTLFLDKTGYIGNEKSLDEPGKAFKLAHWDCWGGERTTMTVIPYMYDRPSSSDFGPALISDTEDDSRRTVTQSIAMKLEEERRRDSGNPWGGSDLHPVVSTTHDLEPITDEELQSIKFHPEDEKFYPKEYRRWRYSFDNGNHWTSFHRLSGRQKLIVEMKLAPRICVLVRTRWPLATVRDFSPVNKFPIV